MELKTVRKRIFQDLVVPPHWKEIGVNAPNLIAKNIAFNICCKLYKSHNLQPFIILPTVEEGVYIKYVEGDRSLVIEAYNDTDISLVICENKKILYHEDIHDMDFEKAVTIFKRKDCMKRIYGFRPKKWYGLKRGTGPMSYIMMVLSSAEPISKKEFYNHDLSIEESPSDHVVELKLTTIKVIE
jgi:hypothetical protein